MAIKHIIVLFVETPRKFITAVINLRGVSTNKTIKTSFVKIFKLCIELIFGTESQLLTGNHISGADKRTVLQ